MFRRSGLAKELTYIPMLGILVTDIVDKASRSRMMASIRSKNTKPEIVVRRYLHAAGFRYRLHQRSLPGCPDIVLAKYRCVVFVHGCFWHRHPGCDRAYTPKTRRAFWKKKFDDNVSRDRVQLRQLRQAGWRPLVIWECQVSAVRYLKHLARKIKAISDGS